MYQLLMLHLIGETCCYLGTIGIVLPFDDDEPITKVEQWWDDFQATKPESDVLFIDWLVEQERANEIRFDDESPNLPLQVYLQR